MQAALESWAAHQQRPVAWIGAGGLSGALLGAGIVIRACWAGIGRAERCRAGLAGANGTRAAKL